jgi:hypothetical protein
MEMYELDSYRSDLFTATVTNAILDTLRALSEDVFENVGFLDARSLTAIIYDSSNTANMKRERIPYCNCNN